MPFLNDTKKLRTMLAACRGELEPMTPTDFKDAIAAVGMLQEEAGVYFGRSPRVGQRWALGEQPIPFMVQASLEFMMAEGLMAIDYDYG